MTRAIQGYKGGKGGGGGGGGVPSEDPDSLRSRQFARIIDVISEGEIEGLATGDLQSVYLDKTPLMNADGSYNFSGVTVVTRNGTQAQSHIEGFPSVESEQAVNVQVTNSTPVVRTITDEVYDSARVTLSLPQMFYTDTATGKTSGSSVNWKIEVQPDGGSYTEVVNDTVTGKTSSRYQRSYIIPLDGDAPWNIRVSRVTADSANQYLQNDTYWDSYTQITNAKLRYPNSALVAMVIDSQQFDSIPVRGYDMKLMRIQIPSNYDPETRVYTGAWDGLFQIAWSDNPAWVFYDMIVNSRYGLGQFIDASQIDKWGLYTIAQYCDGVVPDGFGGQEPRFTCNIYIQQQREAFQVIMDLASIFRGMVYWATGQISVSQDAPADPAALYNCANVLDGVFTYSGSSVKTRHTTALVNWNDPDDFYALKPEYVEDKDGIERYGIVTTSLVAAGCTSRGQANRVGKWLLYSEINETETVSFTSGLDGIVVRPGQIFAVQDKNRAGLRRGGRVVSATTTAITVDDGFTLSVANTYTLSVMLPDGTVGVSEIADITGNVITVVTALAAAPQADAIWMVSSTDLATQLFRAVSVTEGNNGTVEITGLKYNASKYNFVENDIILTENPISVLNIPPDPPTNLAISEALYQTGSLVKNVVTISWDQVERADYYTVTYKVNDANNVIVDRIRTQIYDIDDAPPGYYTVSVVAVSTTGKRSVATTINKNIYGKTLPPSDMTGFSLVSVGTGIAQLIWDHATDLDVIIGGYVKIRHTPDTTSPTWATAIDVGPALPGNATMASVPHMDGTYLAKFVDSSGYQSLNAVNVITKTASLLTMNAVVTWNEATTPTPWVGAKTDVVYPGPLSGLTLDVDGSGNVLSSGEYVFGNYIARQDLSANYISRVSATILVNGYDIGSNIDDMTQDIDDWGQFDGDGVNDVNAQIFIRTTPNDPTSGSAVWSSWRPLFVGQYEARGLQFKLILTSDSPTHNIEVTDLVITIDMPDRVESKSNIASGAGTYTETFTKAFKATPAVAINAYNMATGDYYAFGSISATGFQITFRNAAGTAVSRNFDYMAKGYGYQI